jgi:hypothetical protein
MSADFVCVVDDGDDWSVWLGGVMVARGLSEDSADGVARAIAAALAARTAACARVAEAHGEMVEGVRANMLSRGYALPVERFDGAAGAAREIAAGIRKLDATKEGER